MKDKILYLGTFDSTGYGQASLQTVLAMDSVGLDVVCRQINVNNKPTLPNKILQELLKKSSTGANICVQHILPRLFDYNGHFEQNILFFALETNQVHQHDKKYLKIPSSLWVINEHSKRIIKKNVFQTNVSVINHPVDFNKFNATYNEIGPVGQLKKESNKHVFYTIGEFVSRKNYETLFKAYLSEFNHCENVCLVVKTSRDGQSKDECAKHMIELINHVQRHLKLTKIPEIRIISEFFSEEQMNQLHLESDCFIQLSHGEAWSLPALDAIGFQRTPILPAHSGYLEYVQTNNYFKVDAHEVPCYGCLDVPANLYCGNNTWYDVDIMQVRAHMRNIYNNPQGWTVSAKRAAALKSIQHLSYHKVGNIIKKALNAT